MITEVNFSVKYNEIDQMGIVHHSNYALWFEVGRKDFLKKTGIPYSQLYSKGFTLPLSEMTCEFKSPAKFKDEIIVITKLIYVSYVKIKFEYKVLNKITGKELTTGKTVHVWTDKKIKPINMQKACPEIYELLKYNVEDK